MDHRQALQPDTVLDGKYRIVRVIGAGGFGITYEAFDLGLKSRVAVKEYYPSQFGMRDSTFSVRPRSHSDTELFERLKASFLREGRTLAQFDHPSIVRVLSVFPSHGTAYMVMRFESGTSLKARLAELPRPPTQAELDRLTVHILDALEVMHAAEFLHRDIAPDNIVIRADGTPVLLDFGASRRVMGDMSGTLTGVVKKGYSPPEQYSTDTRSQGPWTDIYALAATLYEAITGARPIEASERMLDDPVPQIKIIARGSYRYAFLDAIDHALSLMPRDRPQTIAEWRRALLAPAQDSDGPTNARGNPNTRNATALTPDLQQASRPPFESGSKASSRRKQVLFAGLAGIALIGGMLMAANRFSDSGGTDPTERSSANREATKDAVRKSEESRRVAAEEAERLTKQETARKAEETRRVAAEAAARRAREEAERLAKEEAARKAEETRRVAAEEAARRAREEAERLAKEEAARKSEESRRVAAEAAARRAREDAERLAKEEAARKAEETRRVAAEEAARRAREDAERQAKEEAARNAEESRRVAAEAAALRAREEAARLAKEEAARKAEELRRVAAEAAALRAREEAARLAKEETARKAEEARRVASVHKEPAAQDSSEAVVIADIRRELNRVGCSTNAREPTWQPADQKALEQFAKASGGQFSFLKLGPQITDTIAGFQQPVCAREPEHATLCSQINERAQIGLLTEADKQVLRSSKCR